MVAAVGSRGGGGCCYDNRFVTLYLSSKVWSEMLNLEPLFFSFLFLHLANVPQFG